MRVGQVKGGWKLNAVASTTPTKGTPQPPDPVFDEADRKFVPLPKRPSGHKSGYRARRKTSSGMYVTLAGVR